MLVAAKSVFCKPLLKIVLTRTIFHCRYLASWQPVGKKTWKRNEELGTETANNLWQKVNNETRSKTFPLNNGKNDFQAAVKQYVEELRNDSLVIKSLYKSISPDSCEHQYSKLLVEGHEDFENNSDTIPIDDYTLRELAKQHAHFIEMPGRLKMPDCEFESYSIDQLKSLLQDCHLRSADFTFIMNKCAKRGMDKLRKGKKVYDEKNKHELFRSNMVPHHMVARESRDVCNWHLLSGASFDNPVVFDMCFEEFMNHKCLNDLHNQIILLLKYNTLVHHPIPILFANLTKDCSFYKSMSTKKAFDFPNGYASITDKGLTELNNIPRESLIYLTPDAKETMTCFEEDKVYIIGGLVDRDVPGISNKMHTLNIAKELGIRRQKLPLNTYLQWGNRSGRNTLSLDIIYQIIHELRATGNWARAFQHIPKRFHRGLTHDGFIEAKKTNDEKLLHWYLETYSVIHPKKPAAKSPFDYFGWDSSK